MTLRNRKTATRVPVSTSRPAHASIATTTRFQRPMRRGGRHRNNRLASTTFTASATAAENRKLISEMLKAGRKSCVADRQGAFGQKRRRHTSQWPWTRTLPGLHAIRGNHLGVSRRQRFRGGAPAAAPSDHGIEGWLPRRVYVRTAAEGAPDDEIRADVEFLGRTWKRFALGLNRARFRRCCTRLEPGGAHLEITSATITPQSGSTIRKSTARWWSSSGASSQLVAV